MIEKNHELEWQVAWKMWDKERNTEEMLTTLVVLALNKNPIAKAAIEQLIAWRRHGKGEEHGHKH